MADFTVASEAVAGTAQRMDGFRQEFESGAQTAQQVVYGVCSASWTGQAADDFARLWQSWSADALVVHGALEQMARVLADTAAEYAQTEAHITSMSEGAMPAPLPSGARS